MSRRNYLVALLLVILAFNYVDRLALGVVLQDIKSELLLSDTQLGLLSGLAFALFYSLMGVPIARWADRGNRVTIIATTTALWSVAVALCGLAGSFWQLLLIRAAVAVGEAGCIPPAQSLISDHFDRAERPRALARYLLGGPLSVVGGYFIAGWLNEVYGWRWMFAMVAAPGLILALLAAITLREPRRFGHVAGFGHMAEGEDGARPALAEAFRTLWANATFRHIVLGYSVISFFAYGLGQWQPAFLIRSHGLTSGELGMWLALIWGPGGMLGTWLGGEWAARRAAGNEPRQLRMIAIVFASFALLSSGVYLTSDRHVAFSLMALGAIGINIAYGPMFATVQTLVPPSMRALAIAMIYFFANLIGMGLGPLAAGALSDALHSAYGDDSLRYALLCLCPGYLWAAWHAWQASRTVSSDSAKIVVRLRSRQLRAPRG